MAKLVKQKGFEVTLLTDTRYKDMVKVIRNFGKNLKNGGIGFFLRGSWNVSECNQLLNSSRSGYCSGSFRAGYELSQVMKSVGAGVRQETEKKQVPWRSTSVIGIFYFSGQEETTEVAGNRLGIYRFWCSFRSFCWLAFRFCNSIILTFSRAS